VDADAAGDAGWAEVDADAAGDADCPDEHPANARPIANAATALILLLGTADSSDATRLRRQVSASLSPI